MTLGIELEREDDGRWLAEVPALSGVMCYGTTRDEAVARVQALALHDRGKIGPRMLASIARRTGLRPEDL